MMKLLMIWLASSGILTLLFWVDSYDFKNRWKLQLILSPIIWPIYVCAIWDQYLRWTRICLAVWFLAIDCALLLIAGAPLIFLSIMFSGAFIFFIGAIWLLIASIFMKMLGIVTKTEWIETIDLW